VTVTVTTALTTLNSLILTRELRWRGRFHPRTHLRHTTAAATLASALTAPPSGGEAMRWRLLRVPTSTSRRMLQASALSLSRSLSRTHSLSHALSQRVSLYKLADASGHTHFHPTNPLYQWPVPRTRPQTACALARARAHTWPRHPTTLSAGLHTLLLYHLASIPGLHTLLPYQPFTY
jgi:hypothetical protein